MKANDKGVPKDEIVLAKLVQNARARELKWTRHTLYKENKVATVEYDEYATTACCAIGAARLEKDTQHSNISSHGNDADSYPDSDSYTYTLNGFTSAYMLGAGFRCAMKD